jgi:hypothetical protein
MKWKKIRKIFEPNGMSEWMVTHAAVPFGEEINEDMFKVYFNTRDFNNRAHVAYLIMDMCNNYKILEVSEYPVIAPGELGNFDEDGTSSSGIVNVGTEKFIYYSGWNRGVTIPFRWAIGLAISKDGGNTFKKYSPGPILDRSPFDPCSVATGCVLNDNGIFKMWYLSCIKWEIVNGKPRHFYHLKYATSNDGINWLREGVVAIDFKSSHEYAIATPSVIKDGPSDYKMWYSYRGQKDIETYRIGYAESKDGINWIRKDEEAGIDVSGEGWDSEMICYPYVFDHKGKRYMLHNGNGYGKTGFGLAVLEQD